MVNRSLTDDGYRDGGIGSKAMKERNTATHSVIAAIDSLMNTDAPEANASQVANLIAASISRLVPRDQRSLCAVMMDKKSCPLKVFRQLIIGDVDGLEHLVANAAWVTQEHARPCTGKTI